MIVVVVVVVVVVVIYIIVVVILALASNGRLLSAVYWWQQQGYERKQNHIDRSNEHSLNIPRLGNTLFFWKHYNLFGYSGGQMRTFLTEINRRRRVVLQVVFSEEVL